MIQISRANPTGHSVALPLSGEPFCGLVMSTDGSTLYSILVGGGQFVPISISVGSFNSSWPVSILGALTSTGAPTVASSDVFTIAVMDATSMLYVLIPSLKTVLGLPITGGIGAPVLTAPGWTFTKPICMVAVNNALLVWDATSGGVDGTQPALIYVDTAKPTHAKQLSLTQYTYTSPTAMYLPSNGSQTLYIADCTSLGQAVLTSTPLTCSDSALRSLVPSHGQLLPAFSSTTFNYTIVVGMDVTALTLTATPDSQFVYYLQYNIGAIDLTKAVFTDLGSTDTTPAISLSGGTLTVATIRVVSQDLSSQSLYFVRIFRVCQGCGAWPTVRQSTIPSLANVALQKPQAAVVLNGWMYVADGALLFAWPQNEPSAAVLVELSAPVQLGLVSQMAASVSQSSLFIADIVTSVLVQVVVRGGVAVSSSVLFSFNNVPIGGVCFSDKLQTAYILKAGYVLSLPLPLPPKFFAFNNIIGSTDSIANAIQVDDTVPTAPVIYILDPAVGSVTYFPALSGATPSILNVGPNVIFHRPTGFTADFQSRTLYISDGFLVYQLPIDHPDRTVPLLLQGQSLSSAGMPFFDAIGRHLYVPDAVSTAGAGPSSVVRLGLDCVEATMRNISFASSDLTFTPPFSPQVSVYNVTVPVDADPTLTVIPTFSLVSALTWSLRGGAPQPLTQGVPLPLVLFPGWNKFVITAVSQDTTVTLSYVISLFSESRVYAVQILSPNVILRPLPTTFLPSLTGLPLVPASPDIVDVQYEWLLTRLETYNTSDPTLAAAVAVASEIPLNVSGFSLVVPADYFLIGFDYSVSLQVYCSQTFVDPGSLTRRRLLSQFTQVLQTGASSALSPQPSPVYAKILGGSTFTTPPDAPLVLIAATGIAASLDYDPALSSVAPLIYSWTCVVAPGTSPCPLPAAVDLTSSTVTIPAASLPAAGTNWQFSLTVAYRGRTDATTASVSTSPSGAPRVAIDAPSSVAVNQPLRMSATVSSTTTAALALEYVWTAEEPLIGQLLAVASNLLSTSLGTPFLAIAGSVLPIGSHSFRVTVKDTTLASAPSGYAIAVVEVVGGPSGGSCAIIPASGVALTTQFPVTCVNWTDTLSGEPQPVTYSLQLLSPLPGWLTALPPSASAVANSLLLTLTSYNPTMVTFLPAGSGVQLGVEIADASNGAISILQQLPPMTVTESSTALATPLGFIGTLLTSTLQQLGSADQCDRQLELITLASDLLNDLPSAVTSVQGASAQMLSLRESLLQSITPSIAATCAGPLMIQALASLSVPAASYPDTVWSVVEALYQQQLTLATSGTSGFTVNAPGFAQMLQESAFIASNLLVNCTHLDAVSEDVQLLLGLQLSGSVPGEVSSFITPTFSSTV